MWTTLYVLGQIILGYFELWQCFIKLLRANKTLAKLLLIKGDICVVLSKQKEKQDTKQSFINVWVLITKDCTMLFALITTDSSYSKILFKKRKQRRKFHFHHHIRCVARGVVDTLYFKSIIWIQQRCIADLCVTFCYYYICFSIS